MTKHSIVWVVKKCKFRKDNLFMFPDIREILQDSDADLITKETGITLCKSFVRRSSRQSNTLGYGSSNSELSSSSFLDNILVNW